MTDRTTGQGRLYVPHVNAMPEHEARDLVAAVGVAQLVTAGQDGLPDASLLPVLWTEGRLLGHVAVANRHWRRIADGTPALAVVTGRDAYVSPGWYASKVEHGRVVPTWNYRVVHLRGPVSVRRDPEFLREVVTALTDRHEDGREQPWSVQDPPPGYVEKQLRAIVGVEMRVETVEAKAKLSQNRSTADRRGVAAGLAADGIEPDGLVADEGRP